MPRYYFDTFDGADLCEDDQGVDFASDSEMRFAALDALPEIAREELPDGDHREMWVKVRSSDGADLFKATLSLRAEWLNRPAKPAVDPKI